MAEAALEAGQDPGSVVAGICVEVRGGRAPVLGRLQVHDRRRVAQEQLAAHGDDQLARGGTFGEVGGVAEWAQRRPRRDPDDVVDPGAGRGVRPIPEPADGRAAGGHGNVAPAQLGEQLGVEAGQEGVDEDRVGFQRDDAVLGQLAHAGQQPLVEGAPNVGPGGTVQAYARLGRGQRLCGIDAAADRAEHPPGGRRTAVVGSKAAATPAARALIPTGLTGGSSSGPGDELREQAREIGVIGSLGEAVAQVAQFPAERADHVHTGRGRGATTLPSPLASVASACPHGTARPAWAAWRIAMTIWPARGFTGRRWRSPSRPQRPAGPRLPTCPVSMARRRARSKSARAARSSGRPSIAGAGRAGAGWRPPARLRRSQPAASVVRAGPDRSTRRAAAENVPRAIVRSSAVASSPTVPVVRDQPGQRRAEQPQPRGRVGGHAAPPQRPGRGHAQDAGGAPAGGPRAARPGGPAHRVTSSSCEPDADLQAQPGDAAVARVEVEARSPRWFSGAARSIGPRLAIAGQGDDRAAFGSRAGQLQRGEVVPNAVGQRVLGDGAVGRQRHQRAEHAEFRRAGEPRVAQRSPAGGGRRVAGVQPGREVLEAARGDGGAEPPGVVGRDGHRPRAGPRPGAGRRRRRARPPRGSRCRAAAAGRTAPGLCGARPPSSCTWANRYAAAGTPSACAPPWAPTSTVTCPPARVSSVPSSPTTSTSHGCRSALRAAGVAAGV